jgi:hypothetical protein
MCVCPIVTTREPPNGFSWNFMSGTFDKSCRYNPAFDYSRRKITDTSYEVLHAHLEPNSLNIYRSKEMFRIRAVEENGAHAWCPKYFSVTLVFFEIIEQNGMSASRQLSREYITYTEILWQDERPISLIRYLDTWHGPEPVQSIYHLHMCLFYGRNKMETYLCANYYW